MGHKCFISFKTEDSDYKDYIQNDLDVDMIDKSMNEPIDSEDEDYIMRKIREDYLSESTVTIFLIGNVSAENSIFQNQNFIKRELQASLYDGQNNTKSGILGIVLPNMYSSIFAGSYNCSICNNSHTNVKINDSTVIKEFSYNYYIPNDKCSWAEEDRYCVLVKWEDFIANPEIFINNAFDKRSNDIANKTKVKP
ncbi:MTH538 TIR-like domain [Lutibacter oricola]|uniref:MTH538 TIR-like domain n=1 Tax=Lutibacter oricola TaxID=762486 RepID=A0A1H3E7Q9_9FLAO|nr:TIR domain-containing protein [Lutibacter oricola]SDX74802.1 MTH538 TIR-like domain [Lutibacter oricola]